jgi:protein-L-isoaspartate(D-aspartate) O-methyltransferase
MWDDQMKNHPDETAYTVERKRMVEEQIKSREVHDHRVLEALQAIPRHKFVPPEHRHLSYADGPLPIGSGQTISQPYIVALMTELLRIGGGDNVLEVGTGSGYQAAILGYLARQVHTIERHAELAKTAAGVLNELGIKNVQVHVGDGSVGLPEYAPYQAIIVTAAAPDVPHSLLNQLDDGGRMVIPVGGQWGQNLERWLRNGDDFKKEILTPVAFVPLRGEGGWKEERWEIS